MKYNTWRSYISREDKTLTRKYNNSCCGGGGELSPRKSCCCESCAYNDREEGRGICAAAAANYRRTMIRYDTLDSLCRHCIISLMTVPSTARESRTAWVPSANSSSVHIGWIDRKEQNIHVTLFIGNIWKSYNYFNLTYYKLLTNINCVPQVKEILYGIKYLYIYIFAILHHVICSFKKCNF